MKHLTEKFNETINISLGQVSTINEAWGAKKHYSSELKEIFDKFEKKKNAKPSKPRYSFAPPANNEDKAYEILAKYPMQILIDKAEYKPKEIFKPRSRTNAKEFSKVDYGKFIVQQLEEGNLNKEDMLKWWNEYETEISKAKWHDIKFIVKQIDPVRCWNPYYPKDESTVNSIMTFPSSLVSYLKSGNGLTYDERHELREFLSDPVNQEDLKKALKGVKNSIMKARPSFAQGTINHLKSIISNCDYSGGDLEDLIEKEYKDSHKSYYQGGNDRDCEASAIIGLIMKVINKIYGFEVWTSISSQKDEYDNEIIGARINLKGNVSDQSLEGFLDDADNLKFTINKLKVSDKKESTSVHNSSFSSYYNYDFEVICTKKGEEIFHETITDVTIGSYFFSGGW